MLEPCQKPRDVIGTPKLKAPPLSCDCHSHVIGPESEYPFVEDRSFTSPEASSASYVRMLDAIGIERMIIIQPSIYGSNNRRTVDAVAEIGKDRCRGVAMVPQDVTPDEIWRLADNGIMATRFIATARGGPTLDELPGVAQAVAPFGWHIEMYVPYKLWDTLLPIIETLPVPVVFDHMAGLPADTSMDNPNLRAILRLLEQEKAWVKLTGYRNSLTGHPYADVDTLGRTFVEHAPDRCVWGSDWPHTNVEGYMPDDADLLDQLAVWAPDPAVQAKILRDNPARLYGF